MKIKEKKNGKTAVVLLRTISIVAVAIAVVFVVHAFTKTDEPEITSTFISEKLETASELTSAKLTYNGLASYSEGDIPLINKKSFKMIYRAEVDAGIDLADVDITVTDSKVKLLLPNAEILNVTIDPDSLEFYDERFAIFNWEDRNDTVEALKKAEEDVLAQGEIDKLKETAQEQTETVIKGLLSDVIGDRSLVISYK